MRVSPSSRVSEDIRIESRRVTAPARVVAEDTRFGQRESDDALIRGVVELSHALSYVRGRQEEVELRQRPFDEPEGSPAARDLRPDIASIGNELRTLLARHSEDLELDVPGAFTGLQRGRENPFHFLELAARPVVDSSHPPSSEDLLRFEQALADTAATLAARRREAPPGTLLDVLA